MVNEEFVRIDNVLATIPIEKEHTGEEISKLIEECLEKNRLKLNKLVAMVRDDASNMLKSCRLLGIARFAFIRLLAQHFFWFSFQCSAHFYHLVVSDALKSSIEATDLIAKVRKWVESTHRSSLAGLLSKFQASEGIGQTRIPMVFFCLSGFNCLFCVY